MATLTTYKKIGKSSFIYGIGIIASRFASFLLLPIYTRYLTPRDYGVLELLDMAVTIFSMFLGGRFADAMLYHYSGAETTGEKKRILSTTLAGSWLIGLMAATLGIAGSPIVAWFVFQSLDFTPYLRLTFLGFGLSLPVEVAFAWLRGTDRPTFFVLTSLLRMFGTLGLTIVFVVFCQWRVLGVLWSNLIISAVLAAGISIVSLLRSGLHLDRRVFWSLCRFALPMSVGGLALFIIHSGDRFFLQRYTTLTDLGIYALAYKLGMLVSQVQVAFGTYWTAQGYNVLRGPDGPPVFAKLNTYMLAVIVWSAVAVVAFSPPVLFLMARPPFHPALQYVPWIALAYVLRAEADYMRFLLYTQARTATDAALTWAAAIICLAGYALLIPRYRLWGAVIATLIAFCFLTVGARYLTGRAGAFPVERRRLLHLSLPAVAIAAAVMKLKPGGEWWHWGIALGATAAYPGALYVTGFLRSEEQAALWQMVGQLRDRLRSTVTAPRTDDIVTP